jgi:NAD-dependent dihydropyrimidine dehydrogenase PreA subunit
MSRGGAIVGRKFSRSGSVWSRVGRRDGHQELEDRVAVVGMLLRIVIACPEDVVHLEHDEPEFWVEVRPARAARVVARVATPEMSAPRTSSLNGARGG